MAITLTFINQYCGYFTLIIYSVVIFQESGTTIDAHNSTIMLGIVQILGNLSSTSLVERLGRKALLILSLAGSAIGLIIISIYLYLDTLAFDLSAFQWTPLVSLCFVVFSSSIGIIPLLMLCIVESVPAEARSFGLAISVITLNLFASISTNLFPILSETIHLYGCMMMYAIFSALGIIFVAAVIKETKGKSLDTIDNK